MKWRGTVIVQVDSNLGVSNETEVAKRVVYQCREIARSRWDLDVTHWTPTVWLSRLFARVEFFPNGRNGKLVCQIVSYDWRTGEVEEARWELG